MKVTPEADQYVEWSTVVDNFVWSGTRAELLAHGWQEGWKATEERILRADQAGTSALWEGCDVQPGAWDDPTILVTNDPDRDGYFVLNRADLAAYVAGDSSVLQANPDEDWGDDDE